MPSFLSSTSFDAFVLALTTFFALIGPLDVATIFAVLSGHLPKKRQQTIALQSVGLALLILITFAFFGQVILTSFGISLSSLKVAGGILLLIISIQMVFGHTSTATSASDAELEEAKTKTDITVFPLTTPLIAGPAAIGGSILLVSQYSVLEDKLMVVLALVVILITTLFCMLIATKLQKLLGVTGTNVIQRIFGVLLSALSVQFILDGLSQSILFSS